MRFSKIKTPPHDHGTPSSHRIKRIIHLTFFISLFTAASGLVTPIKRSDARPPVLLFSKANNHERNRREILKTALLQLTPLSLCVGLVVAPLPSKAVTISEASKKYSTDPSSRKKVPRMPYASLEALLPAARVKYNIDKIAKLTKEILALSVNDEKQSTSTPAIRKEEIISMLEHLLLDPKNYMMPLSQQPLPQQPNDDDQSPIVSSLVTETAEKAKSPKKEKLNSGSKLYQRTYADKIKSLPARDIPLALLTQAGDYRQFSLLQNRQRALEGQNPIRAALNYYTRQLQFDTEFYVLTANAEDKRRMIRNDALPDIKSVIVSDLDLRDLVRNQILDSWEDCQAEFRYQVRRGAGGGGDNSDLPNFDAEELDNLLLRVQGYCDEWFAFIPENDTSEALGVIFKEEYKQF